MPKSLTYALVILALILFLVLSQKTWALASTTTGTISGIVADSTGSPLAGVAVSAVAPSQTSRSVTAANGFYSMTGLAPDTYLVTFSKTGYASRQVPGLTVIQGQTATLNFTLASGVTVLGHVTVRSATSLVQPSTTADVYTMSTQTIQSVTGTPQNISETVLLTSLPGITTDINGYPIIRGGAENEAGYQLEGVDATDPITGQFINSLSLAGESRVVLSTGGYDVSAGNTNAGVVNEVIKRGAYPGSGQATSTVNEPNFDHRIAVEYGNAAPDNRLSYFFAFNGLRQFRAYGDTKTFLPRLVGNVGNASGNINVVNLFYRWGRDNANEIEYMGETGFSAFYFNFGIDPAITPYATNNNLVQLLTGGTCKTNPDGTQSCTGGAIDQTTLFPGQTTIAQNTGYPDNENNVHTIEKLNYKRQFSASSFGNFTSYRTIESDIFLFPWNGGAFGDQFEHNVSSNLGLQFDYQNQLNSEHEISFGAATIYTTAKYDLGQPSFAALIFGALDPNTRFFPQTTGLVSDPLHRSNFWVEDQFTPNQRWTIQPGLRWDQEVLDIPANADSLNYSFATDASGFVHQVPGPPIASDITRPSQVSPRLAMSYQVNPGNVLRMSYGKNIEFTPFANVEFRWNGDPLLNNCTAGSLPNNGCFTLLPGAPFPGMPGFIVSPAGSPVAGMPTNNVTNLYQFFQGVFNSSYFAQFTPVRPQRATNIDFSWEHQFPNGFEMKFTPYYRKGDDYVVANTPLLLTLPDGTPIFGSPREQNAGFNKNTGFEFSIQRVANFGYTGFFDLTYDNTVANYNSDFFPSTNNAALALNHVFHVLYLAPVTANLNLNYDRPAGWHIWNEFPYESGYRYGVGTHTFVFVGNTPVEVLNTDLAEAALGNNANTSAYYFTDPTNPGTILNPNITGSRGTPEGTDPGTLRGPQILRWNLTIAHDIGAAPNGMQAGVRIQNALGNYSDALVGQNSRYRNNGVGGFGPTSGTNKINPLYQPYQYPRSPLPFENEATGIARTYSFFLTAKF